MDMLTRMKNPYFWVGLGGVVLTAMGADPAMFTSWEIAGQAVEELVQNPFALCTVGMAVLGVFVDNGTSGFLDG